MRSWRLIVLALLVVASALAARCAPPQPVALPPGDAETVTSLEPAAGDQEQNAFCTETDPTYCESHADCICVEDSGCFLGNRTYYERCEEKGHGCPDFCAHAPPPACIQHQCTHNYPMREWNWTFADCEDAVPETEIARCQAIIAWSVAKDNLAGALAKCQTLGDSQATCYQQVAESIAIEDVDQAEEICDERIDAFKSDLCYSTVAQLVSGLDVDRLDRAIAMCGKIDMGIMRDECHQRLARHVVAFKSVQDGRDFCRERIEDPFFQDRCFSEIARVAEDTAICAEVGDDHEKQSCVVRIYEAIVGDLVESQSEQAALDFCRTDVAGTWEREVCLVEVANLSTDVSICDGVVDAELKNACVKYVEFNQQRGD